MTRHSLNEIKQTFCCMSFRLTGANAGLFAVCDADGVVWSVVLLLPRASRRWSTLCPSCRRRAPTWPTNPGPRSTRTPSGPTVGKHASHTLCSLHIFSSECAATRSNFPLFRRREGTRREGRCQSWRERKAPGSAARRGLHNRTRLPGLHVEVGGVSLSFPPSSALSLANCLFVLIRPVCLFFVSKDLKT